MDHSIDSNNDFMQFSEVYVSFFKIFLAALKKSPFTGESIYICMYVENIFFKCCHSAVYGLYCICLGKY